MGKRMKRNISTIKEAEAPEVDHISITNALPTGEPGFYKVLSRGDYSAPVRENATRYKPT